MYDTPTYLDTYFLTLEQLAKETSTSNSQIQQMRESQLIPGPAYRLQRKSTLKSSIPTWPIFEFPEEEIPYFSKGVIPWVIRAKTQQSAFLRSDFEREFYIAIESHRNSCDQEFLDSLIPQASVFWNDLIQGSWTVCLKMIDATHMVKKEVLIFKIQKFAEIASLRPLSCSEKESLTLFVEALNHIIMPFAPHERRLSSRWHWIDEIYKNILRTTE